MHTSAARSLRHHRLAARPQPGAGTTVVRATAVAIPLVLLMAIVFVGGAAATVAATGYAYFAKDLPDPRQALEALTFEQQSSVYDRTGKVLLAKFGTDRREIVKFADIPPALIDATTSIEDRTFWENSGFDPAAFVSAAIDTIQGNDRGGSTITQQLVKQRLLPSQYVEPGADPYERKVREIIQAMRLTDEYPGDEGKRAIMEAYLNNNFYGNRNYGVAAAAHGYWGKDLKDLTLAQYALLAGIPQWPTMYDLVRNAEEETVTDEHGREQVQLVVPQTSRIVRRRNQILQAMKTNAVLTQAQYTDADFEAAKSEPVILAPQGTAQWRAPHFVWKVHEEVGQLICGQTECEGVDTGGYTIVTTLDYRMQRITEKWVYAAAVIPNSRRPEAALKARGIPRTRVGMDPAPSRPQHPQRGGGRHRLPHRGGARLRRIGVVHGPQVQAAPAAVRRAGRWLAPARLGDQAARLRDRHRRPDHDGGDRVHGCRDQLRERRRHVPWTPTQADGLERGPVRLRIALQFSLNIPAIKAGFLNGLKHQFQRTKDFGLTYPKGTRPVAIREHRHAGGTPDRAARAPTGRSRMAAS